jgi:hypothetical protein
MRILFRIEGAGESCNENYLVFYENHHARQNFDPDARDSPCVSIENIIISNHSVNEIIDATSSKTAQKHITHLNPQSADTISSRK